MSHKLNQLSKEGSINACASCSHICGYGCCHQALPHEEDFGSESSILLYPGELEAAAEETRRHILITAENFRGGKLGYCDRDNFDQSECSMDRNFKPLDCQSYPFFPAMRDGKLILLIDKKRCPLPIDALLRHYEWVLQKWAVVIAEDPAVKKWITSFELERYAEFNPTSV